MENHMGLEMPLDCLDAGPMRLFQAYSPGSSYRSPFQHSRSMRFFSFHIQVNVQALAP